MKLKTNMVKLYMALLAPPAARNGSFSSQSFPGKAPKRISEINQGIPEQV
jgi:hypothetical protein